jgi:hypothetical protein
VQGWKVEQRAGGDDREHDQCMARKQAGRDAES